ncbi:MAG: type II secretion system F family protein, partial [Bdellovibrionales bacterium]|nr:type II secretion system F family protein [Bdellovibrionales bacterium]
ICSVIVTAVGLLVSWFTLPVTLLGTFYLPYSFLERRIQQRASEFGAEYPTVLLATASSLRAGLSAHLALERSIRLLPQGSIVRHQVEHLVADLRRGVSNREALRRFGGDVALPDLVLFRRALLLVLEHGGRFAPTLMRLAQLSRDRQSLVRGANVATSSMRMTANVLLILAPALLGLLAIRNREFWSTISTDPIATALASTGAGCIGLSIIVLRRMSDFRP